MKLLKEMLALTMCAGLVWGNSAFAADTPKADAGKAIANAAAKSLVMNDDARCTKCHDEADAPALLAIGKTKHGTRSDKRTPTCVTCHGESNEHVLNSKNTKERPPPDRTFSGNLRPSSLPHEDRVDRYFGVRGKGTENLTEERNGVCISCHQGGKHMNWNTSAHGTRDVACSSCHTVHAKDKMRDKRQQAEVCYSCHKQQRADANKPSHHPIPEGKMTCSDCHNAHGSAGEKMLVKDTTNALCFTCHAEKRGPFIHNHQPVVEDCSNCHNPHGTTADAMLKMRQPFLCQSCHGESSHPGNVAGIRSLMPNAVSTNIGPGYAQARSCNNCHTNIHGSNNPSKASSSGPVRFFR